MWNTLRNRLLLSFGAILLIMLLLVGLMLLVFLRTRPLPTGDIVQDLSTILLDVRVSESWQITVGSLRDPGEVEVQVTTFLTNESENRAVRTLIMDENRRARFDSAGVHEAGQVINETERVPLMSHTMARPLVNDIFRGEFIDPDGSKWVYVAQPLRPLVNTMMQRQNGNPNGNGGGVRQGQGELLLMVAEPVPQPSLRETIRAFGDEFLRPLVRAGLISLLIALALSVLIARSVARPLQQMSRAAGRIARGDYQQRVPVEGPREVRALAASFNKMTARVAATQQAQRDFLANVSHDLRTPLTSIQGFSQAIAEGVAADPDSAQRAAHIIHDEAARLHRMVEDLLDMARIEAGRVDMLRHAVQIGDLLQGIGDSLSIKAQDQGVALTRDLPPDLPRIAGDGDRLAQVFTNLLDNAIKHTPRGGRVHLSAETNHQGVEIAVQDSGEGIPPEDISRIFERFYQVDKSRQRPRESQPLRKSGVGLGLAITRQIVEAHGGTITVTSQLGTGTTFTVWLPLPAPDTTTVIARR